MRNRTLSVFVVVLAGCVVASGQGTLTDSQRAEALQSKFQSLAINMPGAPNWIGRSNRFWFSRTVNGSEIIRVDADTLEQRPAFDHEKMAASLSAASGEKFSAIKLPFGGPRSDR